MPLINIDIAWNATFNASPTKPVHHFLLIMAGITIIDTQSNTNPAIDENILTTQIGIIVQPIKSKCFQVGLLS